MGATTPAAQGPKSEPLSFMARMRRFFFRLFILLIVAVPVGLAIYIWAALTFSYSAGERVGYIQKFSKKGWICKTWEGELAMVNLPGAMAQIFPFTVRDADVAAKINTTIGKRVVLHYEQHLGLPTTCFGDTSYFIKAVDTVEP